MKLTNEQIKHRAIALKTVTTSSEWEEVIKIFDSYRSQAADTLKDVGVNLGSSEGLVKELSAKLTIYIVDNVLSDIQDKIKLGQKVFDKDKPSE